MINIGKFTTEKKEKMIEDLNMTNGDDKNG